MRCFCWIFLLLLSFAILPSVLWAQEADGTRQSTPAIKEETTSADQAPPPAAKKVPVQQGAPDEQIAARLQKILEATTWFQGPSVRVAHGVVFLEGDTTQAKYRDWATTLAETTDDVVAVVNRMGVIQRSWWDLSPAWEQIRNLGRQTIQALPLMAVALGVLVLTFFASGWASLIAARMIEHRFSNPILQQVGSRIAAIPVFVIGVYIALGICGLTQVAATIVGGTGLLGLIVGIAFRDITENFLASILISMQRPFELGDQIEVNNIKGIVQSVTTRGTMLLTLDGNHVQIPNSLIYKSVISNLTANPRVRLTFTLPLGKEFPIEPAQTAIVDVIRTHSAVCPEPEPLVLVDEVTAAGSTLRVLCWIDGRQFSPDRVRSALMRLSVNALNSPKTPTGKGHSMQSASKNRLPEETSSEGGLQSECQELEEHSKSTDMPQNGTNLLAAETAPSHNGQST